NGGRAPLQGHGGGRAADFLLRNCLALTGAKQNLLRVGVRNRDTVLDYLRLVGVSFLLGGYVCLCS
ncbi:MAG TPA: hypothetical protein VGP68_18960, partial [Gemmataceae bacterium]|nr:hypothetical protein [Gemmataceae bacterium]